LNKNGDKTERCLTPKLTVNVADHASFHLTQALQPENQFSKTRRSSTDMRLFINFRYKPWWLTLSKALDKSIEHKFAVLPPHNEAVNNLSCTKNCVAAS